MSWKAKSRFKVKQDKKAGSKIVFRKHDREGKPMQYLGVTDEASWASLQRQSNYLKNRTRDEREEHIKTTLAQMPELKAEELGLTMDEKYQFWSETGQQDRVEKAKATTDWGAADLKAEDFIDPATGEPKPLDQVAKDLKEKLGTTTAKSEQEIFKLVRDMAPRFQGQTQAAKQKAAAKMKEDVYKLKAPTVGGGLRAQHAAAKGLETAGQKQEDAYQLAQKKARSDAFEKFEGDVAGFLKSSILKEGGYVFKTKEGNRNRSKKTFLDILSEIPDGKGI